MLSPTLARLLILFCGLLLPAESADAHQTGSVVLNQPADPQAKRIVRDISYVHGGHERQKLDLYLPESESTGLRPVVVWIHGGAWRAGDKRNCPARPLTERGFVVASVNYRLSQHATFPTQLEDCKSAIRWLRNYSEDYRIDPLRIGVWGASAGGHLAALVGTTGDHPDFNQNSDTSSAVQAVCDWFGPTDLLKMNEQAGSLSRMDHDAPNSPESLLLGAPLQTVPDKAAAASPLTYITPDDPPFLIIHGNKDPLVAWQQSQLLHDALQKSGVSSKLNIVPDAGHGRFRDPQITEDVFQFFERQLLTHPGDR